MENNNDVIQSEQAVQPQKDNKGKKGKKKRKKSAVGTVIKLLVWLLIIALGIFLTLFLAARIGEFESIPAMLEYIRGQF